MTGNIFVEINDLLDAISENIIRQCQNAVALNLTKIDLDFQIK